MGLPFFQSRAHSHLPIRLKKRKKKSCEETHFGDTVAGGFHEPQPPPFPVLEIVFPFVVEVEASGETTGDSGAGGSSGSAVDEEETSGKMTGDSGAGGSSGSAVNEGETGGEMTGGSGARGSSGSAVDEVGRLDACITIL